MLNIFSSGREAIPVLLPDVTKYRVIASPTKKEEGSWIGAPSSFYDKHAETYWLTYRVRDPLKRGLELHIASSENGENFKDVKVIRVDELKGKAISVERSCILRDPRTGKFKLYISAEIDFAGGSRPRGYRIMGRWVIGKLEDVNDPEDFDPSTFQVVLMPSVKGLDFMGVKDPYVMTIGHCFLMYYTGGGSREQVFLAYSINGERWSRCLQTPVLGVSGWHNFATRPSAILPVKTGFIMYYGGSNREWYAPVYNICIGIAYTWDLKQFIDLTPEKPVLESPSPGKYKTLRYLDYIQRDDYVLFYYEASRQDNSFELRVTKYSIERTPGI